ncbi:hypothetical protein IJJ39_01800 [Candidatus Saccharibacteria bacterium]|nr:hypothetical protein [Candidatus Saccharibacteria bacterium]
MDNNRKINPVILLIGGMAFVVIIVLAAVLVNLLRENPYGAEIKIDNFTSYYSNTPRETEDSLYAALYNIVAENSEVGAEIPASGAMIRDGSATGSYDEAKNMNYGHFIVDIEKLGQSYDGYFEWSNNSNNVYYSGYATLYTCPSSDELIYGDFGCTDMFTGDLVSLFPIVKKLPETVEYYANNYADYVKYIIGYEVVGDNDGLVLVITDYTGGNYERAIEKIREYGKLSEGFPVKYIDKSQDYGSTYAGE